MARPKLSLEGGHPLSTDPFGSLSTEGLPPASAGPVPPSPLPEDKPCRVSGRKRGHLHLRLEKSGRAGKVVTVIDGFVGISLQEKEQLCRSIKRTAGSGGAVKGGLIEIQGDARLHAQPILEAAGFKVGRIPGR